MTATLIPPAEPIRPLVRSVAEPRPWVWRAPTRRPAPRQLECDCPDFCPIDHDNA